MWLADDPLPKGRDPEKSQFRIRAGSDQMQRAFSTQIFSRLAGADSLNGNLQGLANCVAVLNSGMGESPVWLRKGMPPNLQSLSALNPLEF